jgi:hypothetical protein
LVEIQFDFGFGQILDRLVVVEVVNLVNSSEVKGLSLLDVILVLSSEDLCLLEDLDEIGLGIRSKYSFEALEFSQLLGIQFFYF